MFGSAKRICLGQGTGRANQGADRVSRSAGRNSLRREIEIRTVRAPISGRILQMKTRLGEYAQTGVLSTPLMLLGDDTKLHVRVDIDENDAWRFQPCAPAVASVRGNPELKASVAICAHGSRRDPQSVAHGRYHAAHRHQSAASRLQF